MKYYARRIQKLKDIFKRSEKQATGALCSFCYDGLKNIFSVYDWKFNATGNPIEIMIFCNNELVFCHIVDSDFYIENILTFTENFILEEKLELLFKDTQHV